MPLERKAAFGTARLMVYMVRHVFVGRQVDVREDAVWKRNCVDIHLFGPLSPYVIESEILESSPKTIDHYYIVFSERS